MTQRPTWREYHASLPTLREQHDFLMETLLRTEASITAELEPIYVAFRKHFAMSRQQARVAAKLYWHRGDYVARERLIDAAKIRDTAEDPQASLDTIMVHVRRKTRGSPLRLRTLHGEGHCMDGPDSLSEVRPAPLSKAPTARGAGA